MLTVVTLLRARWRSDRRSLWPASSFRIVTTTAAKASPLCSSFTMFKSISFFAKMVREIGSYWPEISLARFMTPLSGLMLNNPSSFPLLIEYLIRPQEQLFLSTHFSRSESDAET